MRINDIEQFFEDNFPKKTLSELSVNDNNNEALINSNKLGFAFDNIKPRKDKVIKTSDTVFFRNNKITFVEFKSGKIGNFDYRFKSFESIISFYNYIYENGFKDPFSVPNNFFEIYFVYKRNSNPTEIIAFSQIEKELSKEYEHLFSKFKIINNENFKKIFKI